MNTQEALVEIEKISRMWKAVDQVHKVIDTVNQADNYIKELTGTRDKLVSEVAGLKTQLELAQAAIEVEREQAGQVLSDAKKEAKILVDVAKDKATKSALKVELEKAAKVAAMDENLQAKEALYKEMSIKLAKASEEYKDLEGKLSSIKAQIAKLLG